MCVCDRNSPSTKRNRIKIKSWRQSCSKNAERSGKQHRQVLERAHQRRDRVNEARPLTVWAGDTAVQPQGVTCLLFVPRPPGEQGARYPFPGSCPAQGRLARLSPRRCTPLGCNGRERAPQGGAAGRGWAQHADSLPRRQEDTMSHGGPHRPSASH